jgi:glyoxylase-like metal-dependent hydrolase (beta-lactamase superfamily II)
MALTLGLLGGAAVAQQPPRGPARDIVKVTGDLYRARNNNYFAIFLVTPDGIVLADPINTAFATWLKEQFAERFKVPVRYVIYSHSHWDHIEGGSVFADTARFVAHENVGRNMDGRIPQMPGDMLDRNNNGRFELDEIVGPLTANAGRCGMPAGFFKTADRNGDGSLTPAELQADIRKPDILYSDRLQLTLGGKTVELIYPGGTIPTMRPSSCFLPSAWCSPPNSSATWRSRPRAARVRFRARAGHSTATRCRSGSARTAPSRRSISTSSRAGTAPWLPRPT